MGLKERANEIQRLVAEVQAEQADEALQIGFDLLGLIKARVQQNGLNAEGNQFSDYSPAYARRGRAELGYQTNYKDFTRTGKLLAEANAQVEGQSGATVQVSIGPTGQLNIDKTAGALKQGDEIFRTSQAERDLVMRAYAQRIISKFE